MEVSQLSHPAGQLLGPLHGERERVGRLAGLREIGRGWCTNLGGGAGRAVHTLPVLAGALSTSAKVLAFVQTMRFTSKAMCITALGALPAARREAAVRGATKEESFEGEGARGTGHRCKGAGTGTAASHARRVRGASAEAPAACLC